MKDKIYIGSDFNTDYSINGINKTITLLNMPQDLIDINQVFLIKTNLRFKTCHLLDTWHSDLWQNILLQKLQYLCC